VRIHRFIAVKVENDPECTHLRILQMSKFVQEQKWRLFHRKSSGKDCDGRQLVNCLYQAAFGRFADTGGLVPA
jgi:hypothetical protein